MTDSLEGGLMSAPRQSDSPPGAEGCALVVAGGGAELSCCSSSASRVEIVMKAAGIPKNASGIGGFVNGAHALVTPALVMVAAVAPLGVDRRRGRDDVRRPARDADRRHVARRAAAAGQRHGADRLTGGGARQLAADRLPVARAGRARRDRALALAACRPSAPACWRSMLLLSALEPSPGSGVAAWAAEPGSGDQRPARRDRAS